MITQRDVVSKTQKIKSQKRGEKREGERAGIHEQVQAYSSEVECLSKRTRLRFCTTLRINPPPPPPRTGGDLWGKSLTLFVALLL